MVNLTDEEEALLAQAQAQGVNVYIQAVPSETRTPFAAKS